MSFLPLVSLEKFNIKLHQCNRKEKRIMSKFDDELYRTKNQVNELMQEGYTIQEAMQLIQTASLKTLAECCGIDYDSKAYLHIIGSIATYEQ